MKEMTATTEMAAAVPGGIGEGSGVGGGEGSGVGGGEGSGVGGTVQLARSS